MPWRHNGVGGRLGVVLLRLGNSKHWECGLLCQLLAFRYFMMASSNGNILRVTGHLCGEFTSHRWIPRTKASDAELWCFFICVWINNWVNNREAGDLRRYRAYYDVTVMLPVFLKIVKTLVTCWISRQIECVVKMATISKTTFSNIFF